MEFQNNNGSTTQNGAATETIKAPATNGAVKTNGNAKAQNGNGEAKDIKTLPDAKAGALAKPETPAIAAPAKSETQPKATAPLPAGQAAEAQPVAEEAKPGKAELTLETKLKAVADLHRRSVQRLTLISRIKLLEEFQIKLAEHGDELENNPYQGCKLIIEDDKRNQFVTSTPNLIKMVSEFIFNACLDKLEEIESTINFPTA